MAKKASTMKRKAQQMAKKNLAKAKVQLARHMRALKLAGKRYRVALKSS